MNIKCYEGIAREHTEKILEDAKNFYINNRHREGIENTFGYFTNHIVAPLNKRRLNMILSYLLYLKEHFKSALKILDIACGSGLITKAVSELGFPTVGIDINPVEIELAKDFSKFCQSETYLNFVTLDVINDRDWKISVEEKLNGKPDLILLCYALHHLPYVEKFILTMSKWLDSGKYLLINEENPLSPLFLLKHIIRSVLQRDTASENHKSYNQWKKIISLNGFKVFKPIGIDPVKLIGDYLPNFSWSYVFLAQKI